MIVVPDAGPLIYLGGAGQLDLLRVMFTRVVVPRTVHAEVVEAGAGLTGSAEVAAADWLELVDAPLDDALTELDAGEAAAIALAEQVGALLLCDDAALRDVARTRGLTVIGSLGVLLRAKHEGHLRLVAPVVTAMIEHGMYVSPALLERVLDHANERQLTPAKARRR